MVKFNGVTKKFGEILALNNVTFSIDKGEFVFITGPSGAGKTTVARLILREYLPTSGLIKVDGQDLSDLKNKDIVDLRRKIGMVFQDFKLLQDWTVYENVALALQVVGEKKENIDKLVRDALEWVGLGSRADFFPAQLAGGELQRVCLARAIVRKPMVIIADEPTGNLDPTTAWQIVRLLKKANDEGCSVIMATHNFDIVNSMKARVIEIEKGKIVSDVPKGKYKAK